MVSSSFLTSDVKAIGSSCIYVHWQAVRWGLTDRMHGIQATLVDLLTAVQAGGPVALAVHCGCACLILQQAPPPEADVCGL